MPSKKVQCTKRGNFMYRVKQVTQCAGLLAVGLALAGCQKIGPTGNIPETCAIPSSFGDLVAVTPAERAESVLWFKQPDQTIVAVGVNSARGTCQVHKTRYPRS
jgi:hypothetical protein